jgi:hypothetical protein
MQLDLNGRQTRGQPEEASRGAKRKLKRRAFEPVGCDTFILSVVIHLFYL